MLAGAGKDIGSAIETLGKHASALKELMQETGFKRENISSLLHGAGKNMGLAIDTLVKYSPKLATLMQETGFSPSNISSLLHGAGKNMGLAIETLVDYSPKLATLMQETGFKPENISNMLHGAATDLDLAIRELILHKDEFLKLTDETLLTTKDISGQLQSSGVNIGENINRLIARKNEFVLRDEEISAEPIKEKSVSRKEKISISSSSKNQNHEPSRAGLPSAKTFEGNHSVEKLEESLKEIWNVASYYRTKKIDESERDGYSISIKILNKKYFSVSDNNQLLPKGDYRGNVLAFSYDDQSAKLKYYSYREICDLLDREKEKDGIPLAELNEEQRQYIASGLFEVLEGQFESASLSFHSARLTNKQALNITKLATILLAEKTRSLIGGHGRLTINKAILNINRSPNFSAIFSDRIFINRFKEDFFDTEIELTDSNTVKDRLAIVKNKLHKLNINNIFEEDKLILADRYFAKFAYPGGGAARFIAAGYTSSEDKELTN